MHVENRPPPTPSSVLCLCLCLCFFSVTSFTSVFVSSKSHIFTFKTFFFTNSDGKDTYFFMYLLLILWKSSFCDTELSQPLFHFYFILYFIRIPQCCTHLYMNFIFLWHVFFVSIFVSVIGHVFCGSPDQIAAHFFHQVVYIKTAISLAFERSFPFNK